MKIIRKICDRCGKEIPEMLPMMQSILPVYNIKRYSTDIDLCNDCLKDFDDFMGSKNVQYQKPTNDSPHQCDTCLHELKTMKEYPCKNCECSGDLWEPKE